MNQTLWLAVAAGIAIAAACGLRAFLPLFAIALAGRSGLVTVGTDVAWLTETPVLIALGTAAVAEIIGDKVPVIDHTLDIVATVVRPAAGALAAYAALAAWPEPVPAALALIAGTGALGVHALKAKTRIGSTLFTAGAGNPLLSLAEDLGAVGLTATALLLPAVALLLVLAGGLAAAGVLRALNRRRQKPTPSVRTHSPR